MAESNNDARHKSGRYEPYDKNTNCSAFLGVHVAERVLAESFGAVERTKYGFSGYDFVCGRGYKIDAKSSCRNHTPNKSHRWKFHIDKNTEADYFLCLAFNNRSDLDPEHVWLIPGSKVNKKMSISVSETTLHKWEEWEKPIDKIANCCDILKCVTEIMDKTP